MAMDRGKPLRLAQEIEFLGACAHGYPGSEECERCSEAEGTLDGKSEDVFDRLPRADEEEIGPWLTAMQQRADAHRLENDELRALALQPCA